ncbi:hypothetical protein CYCD_30550 [Tenuifilaceae bacterium CYCD]|nr:hypothetical protein CYCD_30550 [Tenuifilaceae bacterium CYCD]
MNFINYHNPVNKIEIFVRKQLYSEAISMYEQLQKEYPRFFYKDLHNLSICYLKVEKLDSAISIARRLVLQGYTLDDFYKYNEYNCITNNPLWGNFLATYPRLRFEYEKTIDHTFVDMVNRAIVFDQQYQDSSDAKRDSVYYYQGVMLFDYMFKYGFPNFYLNRENVLGNRLMAMLRHFFYIPQILENDPDLSFTRPYCNMVVEKEYNEFLHSAIVMGKLLPSTYIEIVYRFDSSPYGLLGVTYDFDREITYIDLNLNNSFSIQNINEKRRSIGLFEIDTLSTGNIEGTWYSQVSVKVMKEAMLNCDTCHTVLDYFDIARPIREKIQFSYENKELRDFIFNYDPSNLKYEQLKNSTKYMKNLKKKQY